MADKNKLYYGDNLHVLRNYIADASVDLIYLDPPFNSRQDYNVLFAEKDGSRSASQITAFKDSWEWNLEAERSYQEVVERGGCVSEAMRAFRTLLGGSDMLAYLAMMAPRLIELRRVLKPQGSIYLHCDPTASHYLKLLLDSVFGTEAFLNEIIWRRYKRPKGSQFESRRFGRSTDSVFFYSNSPAQTFHLDRVKVALSQEGIDKRYTLEDTKGRYYSGPLLRSSSMGPRPNLVYPYKNFSPGPAGWRMTRAKLMELDAKGDVFWTSSGIPRRKVRLNENAGTPVDSLWTDIEALGAHAQERLGYPTQKPEALLERILRVSSNEGDVVLDPFCGCGTTVQVAQRLNRRWIGIDITHLAIGLIKNRLDDAFSPEVRMTYEVIGEPTDLAGAEQLALENKWQFQYWALGLCGARPTESIKKGSDRGIDGRLYFHDDRSGESKQILFSVKGGMHVSVSEIRDLNGVLQRENAAIGTYISLAEPTRPMRKEAAEAGFYTSADGSRYPRLQILTIRGLMDGTERLEKPAHIRDITFRRAPRSRPMAATNLELTLNPTLRSEER